MVPRFFFCFQGVSAFHYPHNRFTYFGLVVLFSGQITHGITHGGREEKGELFPGRQILFKKCVYTGGDLL